MRRFDYSFLKNKPIPANTIALLTTVNNLATERNVMKVSYPDLFGELSKLAIVQSVISSNAIEGIVTTDDRIKGLLAGNVSPINHNENEILGYKDVLNLIHSNYGMYQFSEDQILDFHRLLLSYERPSYAGSYKKEDNVIMEVDAFGIRSIRYKPTSALETKPSMEQMVYAYIDSRDDVNINQLLLIPCVILDFLCIHPFSDGNGRISRLLSILLLYKNGYDIGKYVSFENQINNHKKEYYEALKNSSFKWADNDNSYFPFINHFLMTLIRCYSELDNRFNILSEKKLNKKDRVKEAILKSFIPVSRKDILELWPDISLDTIKKALIELQNEKIIVKVGNFKDAKYISAKRYYSA